MEGDDARLDRVFKLCGSLYKHFNGITSPAIRTALLAGLERRFAAYDQPVMLITYMLNPARCDKHLNQDCDFVSWANALQLVEQLYLRFYDGDTDGAAKAVDQFLNYQSTTKPFTKSKSLHEEDILCHCRQCNAKSGQAKHLQSITVMPDVEHLKACGFSAWACGIQPTSGTSGYDLGSHLSFYAFEIFCAEKLCTFLPFMCFC